MRKTTLCLFVLIFPVVVVVNAENRDKKGETPPGAVESVRGEQTVDESAREFTWRGKLVDQDCKDKHIDQTCPVSPATKRFGLVIDGGIILPFGEAGNQKTQKLVADGGHKGNIEVSVVGLRQGGAFNLQSIEIAK